MSEPWRHKAFFAPTYPCTWQTYQFLFQNEQSVHLMTVPPFDDNEAPSSSSASLMILRLIERHQPAAQQMAPASGPEEWSIMADM